MLKELLLLSFVFMLAGCNDTNNPKTKDKGENDTEIVLTLANHSSYISEETVTGFTGAYGYSPYKSWVVFTGVLDSCIYNASVSYSIISSQGQNLGSFTIQLNAAGDATTEPFDRFANFSITDVSGTISFYN